MEIQERTIKNMKDFIEWIYEVQNVCNKDNVVFRPKTYYRGQASKAWKLQAGVFRKNYNEYELLRIAVLRLYRDMSKYQTYLDKLIFLQHYGLATRLLDVTFNPLIALYMACSENNEEDGVVYCGHYSSSIENGTIVDLTSEFIFTHRSGWNDKEVEFYSKIKEVTFEDFCKPWLVFPPFSNPRIEQQNGAFLLTPLIGRIDGQLIENGLTDFGRTNLFDRRKAIIPSSYKNTIIAELSDLGVNKGTIYQGVTEKLQSIIQENLRIVDNIVFE